jgi:hypothetical protein
MMKVLIENCEGQAAVPQCIAISRMLLKHLVESRNPKVDSGKPVSKILSGKTDDGPSEHF